MVSWIISETPSLETFHGELPEPLNLPATVCGGPDTNFQNFSCSCGKENLNLVTNCHMG